jgi:hypothetical protein
MQQGPVQREKAEGAVSKQPAPVGSPSEGANTKLLRGMDFEAQQGWLEPSKAEARQSPVGEAKKGDAGAVKAEAVKGADAKAPEGAAKAPPELQADAYVMTRDAAYAKSGFLGWFGDQITAKVSSWGLTPGTPDVSLASDKGAPVVALKWSGAWGTAPQTREFGFDMRPLDAKAAVKGVAAVKGWAKVADESRGKLEPVLGGETNGVSQSARDALRAKFAGLAGQTEDEQAATLEGIIGAKDATPHLANEQVQTAPPVVTLSGPSEQAGYAFAGGAADAHVYQASYADGVNLEIVAPKAPDPALHHHTVAEAADAARFVPTKNRAVIKTILLNTQVNPDDAYWAVQYNTPGFHSYMTAGAAGVVTIYPNTGAQPDANVMRGSMIHETGHTWSYQNWGEDTTQGKWLDWKGAMDKDRVSVSQYAMNDIAEDVAETVRVYGSTKGNPTYDEYKAMIPNRLAILEKEIG